MEEDKNIFELFNDVNISTSYIKFLFKNKSNFALNKCFENEIFSNHMIELLVIYIKNIITCNFCIKKKYPSFLNIHNIQLDENKFTKFCTT